VPVRTEQIPPCKYSMTLIVTATVTNRAFVNCSFEGDEKSGRAAKVHQGDFRV